MYDTVTNAFKPNDFLPSMTQTRFSHGLFQFGPSWVYAVCGNTSRADHDRNIERLNVANLLEAPGSEQWEVLHLEEGELFTRYNALMAPIS